MKWSEARRIALARDWYQCQVCHGEDVLTVHHIWPRSLGGSDEPYNLVTLCEECHQNICVRCSRHVRLQVKKEKVQADGSLISRTRSYVLDWT